MKILLANDGCTIGGIETWMIALSSALRARGHTCELFFFRHGAMENYLPSGCVAHFGSVGDLLRLVDEQHFDIVHAHSGDFHLGISAVRALGAKLVVTSHGWVIPGWTSFTCDAFIGASNWLADAQRPLTDLTVSTVTLGIETDEFKADEMRAGTAPPIIAWVGRGIAVEQKRIDKLAAIAPALKRAGFRLWLAEASGAKSVAHVLPGAAEVLEPLADVWCGVPRTEMPEFFRTIAASGGCVVSTSSYEGLGLAYVEAQACGCPVIAPDVRGVNEAVRPEHGGVLYPFEIETEELARLVIATVQDQEGMKRRRESGMRFAREQFGLKRMTDEHLQIYERVLKEPRASSLESYRRFRLLLHPKSYILHNWSAAHALYESSREFAARGEERLAAIAARTSLAMCPTLYMRPRRLAHMLKTQLRSANARANRTERLA
jgi:glycosyltransferase involved in cell wall biosynthesis